MVFSADLRATFPPARPPALLKHETRAEILQIAQVVRDYGERVRTRALAGVDLVLERGEFAALIGPSGSGKSTLLNIVGLPARPTSGRVVLAGADTAGLDEDALTRLRARTLGFVFQFHHLLPAFTAVENVMLPAWADEGWPSREMRARADELLDAVGLRDRAGYKTSDLSGGEAARRDRAGARSPALARARRRADRQPGYDILRRDRRVTHDPRIANRCNRIIEIVDGRVKSDHARPA